MHLVGFIIRIYHEARSPERQILKDILGEGVGWIVVGRYRENWLARFRAVMGFRSFMKRAKFLEWRRKKDAGTWSFLHDVISKRGQGLVSATATTSQTVVNIADVLTALNNFVADTIRGCLFWEFQGLRLSV